MVSMLLQVWEQNFNLDLLQYLVIEEGGLLPEMSLLSLILLLTNIQQVLVTGDQCQLPPYTGTLPDNVICLGHEAAIEKLINNPICKYVALTKNFKSRPVLVEALADASYGGQLKPGRTEEERSRWRVLGFPSPNDWTPIPMLQTTGREQLTLERSRSNDLHNEIAVMPRRFIVDKIPSAEVIILCYYSDSVTRIARLDLESHVFSINRYQGRECDFAIIVTSRVAQPNIYQNVDFVLDARRTTVTLSRAREGVFIIGDMEMLGRSRVWRTYVEKYPVAFSKLSVFHSWMRKYDQRRSEGRSYFS